MTFRNQALNSFLYFTCLILFQVKTPALAAEEKAPFRQVLQLAGIDSEQLAQFGLGSEYSADDWQLVSQILHRLGHYPPEQLVAWTSPTEPQQWWEQAADHLGLLCDISGQVESLEILTVPPSLALSLAPALAQSQARPLGSTPRESQEMPVVYRCSFRSASPKFSGTLITRQIPSRWQAADVVGEPVRFRGVLLQLTEDNRELRVLLLTDRLAWYPVRGAPSGHLLLARHGMDVALFDEVIHRQPFVRPEISREGEAFYGCLDAIGRVKHAELIALCRENVTYTADKWRGFQAELRVQQESLKDQRAQALTAEARQALDKEEAAVRQRLLVAAAVDQLSKQGQSSLGPMFLQPDAEVGELVRIEGVARRAVRIAVPERPEIGDYYEMEVFAPESKLLENRPVVCCVNRLPPGFPQGDVLREPVRISGVFFKSWRYRTRKAVGAQGEAERRRQLYTPLLLADVPSWINQSAPPRSPLGLWAGIAFLVALAVAWLSIAGLARRDRRARQALRRSFKDEIELRG